jgi:hypothetical protein
LTKVLLPSISSRKGISNHARRGSSNIKELIAEQMAADEVAASGKDKLVGHFVAFIICVMCQCVNYRCELQDLHSFTRINTSHHSPDPMDTDRTG